MAVPSAPRITFTSGSRKHGEDQFVRVYSGTDSDSMTCYISQTYNSPALWQQTLTAPTEYDSSARWWGFHYPTDSIASSPYYISAYGSNSDGNSTTVQKIMELFMPPTVAVTSPANGATLTSSAVTVVWTAMDQTGISYQAVSVSKDGAELWADELDGDARSATVPQSVVFSSGESYSFSVTARNGKGMETTATSTASFYFATPTSAVLEIAEGAGKSAVIEVTGYTERESSSQPNPDYVDVARVNPDGSLWMVATGLHVGDTVTDPLPPLGSEAVYKAIGRVVNAGVSEATYTVTITTCCWALNFDASTVRMVGRNPSSSTSYDHGGELYHFARGYQNPEDMLPEFYPVGAVDGKGSLEFDAETREGAVEIMGLFFQHPTVWIRTPFGERMRAKASASLSLSRDSKRITVSYDLVRFGEAW